MLIKHLIITFLSVFKISLENETKWDYVSFLTDFVNKEQTPLKITAFLCWKKAELSYFEKTMYKNDMPIKILKTTDDLIYNLLSDQFDFFVLDYKCPHSQKVLKRADDLSLYKQPFRWLVFGSIMNIMECDFNIDVDSKFYVAENYEKGKFNITAIYKIHVDSTAYLQNFIGTWTNSDERFVSYNKLQATRNRTNLQGKLLRVSQVITQPDKVQFLSDYRYKQVDSITKYNHFLINHLLDYLNASRSVINQATWGYKNATTGIYSGLIGDLQQGYADLAGSPSFFTVDRTDIVDFLESTTPTYMRFIFRQPPLSYVTNVYTLPFDVNVWHYSFVMVTIICVIVYVIVIWEWKDPMFRKSIEEKYGALRPNVVDVIMLEIGAISQQGTDVEPKSSAGRIATIFTFVTLMFMYTSYSANIVALLQSTTNSIRSIDDLLTSRIKLGVEDIVYAHYYFNNTLDPLKRTIYEQKIAPKRQKSNFMTVQEGISRMRQEFFAFHVELSTGYKEITDTFQENEKCGLQEIEFISLIEPWLPAPKNSNYKELVKVGMKKMKEAGIQRREFYKVYTRKPVCHNKGNNFVSVGLIDCYYAFEIFAVGIFVGFAILLIEVIIVRYTLYKASLKVKEFENSEPLSARNISFIKE